LRILISLEVALMSSTWGDKIKLSIFGESHGPALGVVIDGLPAGEKIDFEKLQAFLARRAPGKTAYSTRRKEADIPEILSGLADDVTCGAPLSIIIRNTDARPQDYEVLKDIPRPSHADYAAIMKYGASHDIRGGGHFSGRLTAALCIAGGVCLQVLSRRGVEIGAHILSIGTVDDLPLDPVSTDAKLLRELVKKEIPVLDDEAGRKMLVQIEKAKTDKDRTIQILQFTDIDQVPPVYYDKTYNVVPEGGGEKAFELLRRAMKDENKVAITKTVMGTKEKLLALIPTDKVISAETLFYSDEIKDAPKESAAPAGFQGSEIQQKAGGMPGKRQRLI
jgi:chorismate synthase